MPRTLPKGIYTPLPTFFEEGTEDLDLVSFQKHVQFTASAGTIPVLSGTMGEAHHLSGPERILLIKTARKALDEVGLTSVPIIAGIGATSTRESIRLAKDAAEAGADFAIAISPGYHAEALKADMAGVKKFFVDIAEASPIPVMMYNFPAVTGGIDMDSDLIIDITRSAPNICGVKLTCGSIGKMTRITAAVNSPSFQAQWPRKEATAPFLVIDGFIDFLLPSMVSRSSGAITGLANFAPKTCVKLWELCQAAPSTEEYRAAQELQDLVSNADGIALKIGISGMKLLLHRIFGYGDKPRRPTVPMSKERGDAVLADTRLQILLDYEKRLTI